jgi:MFS family permease
MHVPPTGPRLPRTVWLLIAARAINRLGAFSLSFLTVLITTRFGASIATAGVISATFGLATIPSRLVGGRLSDRIGRRRTIVLGLVGCAVAQVGIAAADSLAVIAGFAVLLGLVFELYEPPSQAMIADAVGATDRVRAYSLMNAALAAAGMGAGLLAAGLGRWDLRWLFIADATTCLICALAVRILLPADRPTVNQLPGETSEVTPWRDRALMAMLASGTLFALIYLQIMITLPLSLTQRGLQPADAGLVLTASALTIVAGQPMMRWKSVSALSTTAGFTSGYALLALGLAGYAAAHTLGVFLAATVVWSLGDLLLMGRAYALVADLAPPAGTGRYMAVYGTSWGIAGITAPLAGTQLLQHAGVTTLWITMAAACLALAAIQPAVARIASARILQQASNALGTAPVSA